MAVTNFFNPFTNNFIKKRRRKFFYAMKVSRDDKSSRNLQKLFAVKKQ